MATKANENAEAAESRDETSDGPLMDSMSAAVKKMIAKAKERGYVTYDELNAVLPPDQMSSEQIEDIMSLLSEMGITVIESEEQDDAAADDDSKESSATATGNLNDDDIGRTDDPVRMYLREMGSVELLSREGEIAIAKRIEAGRERMIGGICESPLTIRALLAWREALIEGRILLRDIIDLDATYGGGPSEDAMNRAVDEIAGMEDEPAPKEEAKDAKGKAVKGKAKDEPKAEAKGESKGAKGKAAKVEETAEATAKGKKAKAGEEDSEEEAGKPEGEGEDDEDDEEEENSISLAAMEAALLPVVLDTFDEISKTWKKITRVQEKRLTHLQRGEKIVPATEKRYEKLQQELVELMEGVHFNNNRLEQLVDQLYGLNRSPSSAASSPRCRRASARPAGQEGDGRGQPAPGHLDRQEVHQPRPAVPRPDPGRQHRPDEGGRQVRVPPRLQVLDLRHLVDPPGDHPLDRRPGAHHPHPGAHDRDDQQAGAHQRARCCTRSAASRRRRSWPSARRCRSRRCARC
jgi:RNA polymerase primary sigma factor